LSPHLRGSSPAADGPPQADPVAAQASREPEQARDLAASLQSGWLRGRETDVPDAEPMTDYQAYRSQDSEAPDGEEA
jgi:hypothetical protein